MTEFKSYINGEFVKGKDFLEIINPEDNSIAGKVSALNEKEIDRAFQSARGSFKDWRDASHESRLKYINKFTELLEKNKKELAEIMSSEIAKPIPSSLIEIERTIDYIRETIKAWEEIKFSVMTVGNKRANLNRVPLGVVLAISPFNYPVNLSLSKIIPALLVGNTVVFKPATNGSLTGGFIAELLDKANFPKGVFNLTTGRGRIIGDVLTRNKNIDMITFTGSIRIGKDIALAQQMKPLVLELGGNDAAYIRKDADIELALEEIIKGAFSFSGQRCTAIKRLILDKTIARNFIDKLTTKMSNVKFGPLVSTSAVKYVEELINDSNKRGDKFDLSGAIIGNVVPAHIVITDKNSRAWNEEAFGPILPIIVVDSENEVLDLFNDTEFGLQNSIFTTDIEWAKEISLKIESGTVNINRSSSRGPDVFPFLGIKNSGFGTQGISYALESMTRILNIVENN